jgi:hypothetical protein
LPSLSMCSLPKLVLGRWTGPLLPLSCSQAYICDNSVSLILDEGVELNSVVKGETQIIFWIKLKDGSKLTMDEYRNLTHPPIAMPEPSHVLVVDAKIVRIRPQRHSKDYFEACNTIAFWYPCH